MWLMLFVIMLPYFADSIKINLKKIKKDPECKFFPLAAAAALMFGAGFINPYGIKAMTYLFTSYGYDIINKNIYEMKSPTVNDLDGKAFFFMIAVIVCSYIFYRKGTTRLRFFLLTAGTLYLGLSSMRSLAILFIASVPCLAYYFKDVKIMLSQSKQKINKKMLARAGAVLCAITVAALGVLAIPSQSGENKDDFGKDDFYTSFNAITKVLDSEGGPENVVIFNELTAGSYLELSGYKAYIDPRVELFLKDNNGQYDYLNEYFEAAYGKIYYKDFINKYDFTHLIIADSEPALLAGMEHDSDFKLIYEDGHYKIFKNMKAKAE